MGTSLHHRDVKLENLFMYGGRVAVGDWGLVKGPDDVDLTDPERPAGPIHSLAPELAAGDPNPDLELVDVYYLAHTLSQLALERTMPARGQIRANEEDSLLRRLPGETEIGRLVQIIEDATARTPARRPSLRVFARLLEEWVNARRDALEARAEHDRFAAMYEEREVRGRAVLQWVINTVRSEPVFDAFTYDVPDIDEPAPDVPGLTEGQMAEALGDLIDDGLLSGEPHHVLGRREPKHFTHLYPTLRGLAEVHEVDDLLRAAAPLLRAFVEPVDVVSLRRTSELTEVVPGILLTPPEAYFEMWLLSEFDHLDFQRLRETGGFATLTNVRATPRGRRWLYESDAESKRRAAELEAERIAAMKAAPWILRGESTVDATAGVVTYRSNLGNSGQGIARDVSLHLIGADGGELQAVPIPDLEQHSVLVDIRLPTDHPSLSARLVWDDGTGHALETTVADLYPSRG